MKYWLLTFFFLVVGSSHAQTLTGTVVGVHDGDTIKVQADCVCKPESIRLNGIDAPEVGAKGDLANWQPYAIESRDLLAELVNAKTVTVEWTKRDKYRRIIGTVYQGGKDINLRVIAAGAAWWFVKYRYDVPKDKRAAYATAESTAREARAGLWADSQPISPWNWRKGLR